MATPHIPPPTELASQAEIDRRVAFDADCPHPDTVGRAKPPPPPALGPAVGRWERLRRALRLYVVHPLSRW
jgi:hypothetical protein